jgi:hypothetical protein
VASINIMQAQSKEMYFIFNLDYRHVALSREIRHGLPTKSQYSTKPNNLSEMSKTQWTHTLHISLKQGKSNGPVSQTGGSDFGCNDYISNSGCSGSKIGCFSFYWLVLND